MCTKMVLVERIRLPGNVKQIFPLSPDFNRTGSIYLNHQYNALNACFVGIWELVIYIRPYKYIFEKLEGKKHKQHTTTTTKQSSLKENHIIK